MNSNLNEILDAVNNTNELISKTSEKSAVPGSYKIGKNWENRQNTRERLEELKSLCYRKDDLTYFPSLFLSHCLPARQTEGYQRINGDIIMSVNAPKSVPYGSLARAFLAWAVTEAKRNDSRFLRIGLFTHWVMEVTGYRSVSGGPNGSCERLRNQVGYFMESDFYLKEWDYERRQFTIIESAVLETNGVITLSKEFFETQCLKGAVPVRTDLMRALQGHCSLFDATLWANWRAESLYQKGIETARIPWHYAYNQFGHGFMFFKRGIVNFKSKFRKNIDLLLMYRPHMGIRHSDSHLIISQFPLDVPARPRGKPG